MSIKDFANIILFILASIVVTIIIPGYISFKTGTFDTDTFRLRLSTLPADTVFRNHDRKQQPHIKRIAEIQLKLDSAIKDSNITESKVQALLTLRKNEEDELKSILPITIIPFYLNTQLMLWLGIYSIEMILIYLINKNRPNISRWNVALLGTLIYCFYEWPLWIRNFLFKQKGRTVYAYPNIDIDPYSFFYQEFMVLIFCILTSAIICLSISKYKESAEKSRDIKTLNDFLIVASYYSTAYKNWFIHSGLLALGFVSFTGFFWKLVYTYGDQRYLLSAINAHILWALAWLAITAELFHYMTEFEKSKRDMLRKNPAEGTLKIVLEHQPTNNLTLVLSGVGSLVTFLSPFIKVLIS